MGWERFSGNQSESGFLAVADERFLKNREVGMFS